MTCEPLRRTLPSMDRRPRPASVAVRVLALASLSLAAFARPARATVTTLESVERPLVRINVRAGNVVIRTWSRGSVLVVAGSNVTVQRQEADPDADDASLFIPEAHDGSRRRSASLPAETFVVAPMPPGRRELVLIRATAREDVGIVTVTIPADTPFLFAHTASGDLRLSDYHEGTFVGFAGRGRLALHDVGGTAFLQTMRGTILVSDSHLDRVRARSLFGNVRFLRCDVRQIETTTVGGSIAYDAGTFSPGLARFESASGDVAIGVSEDVRLGAHAAGGRVFTNFGSNARVDAHDRDAEAVIGSGGPLVTATSASGNVYLYDASLRRKRALAPEWPEATVLRPAPPAREGLVPVLAPVERPTRRPDAPHHRHERH